jgi:Holliday junction resolvasome RuvABC endonuclease subunit
MPNLLLALDSSTRVIGWALLDLDNLDAPLAYGVHEFRGNLHERLYYSGVWLDTLLRTEFPSVTILAIEGQVFAKNAATTAKLAQVAGALKFVALSHGLDVIEVAPGQRCTALGLPWMMARDAAKAQVLALVNARFGLALGADEHDIADALAIGLAAVNMRGWGE